MHGPEGVRFYTRVKTITTRWPTKEALAVAKARGVKLGNPSGAAALHRAGKDGALCGPRSAATPIAMPATWRR
jgi:hypothetical protein